MGLQKRNFYQDMFLILVTLLTFQPSNVLSWQLSDSTLNLNFHKRGMRSIKSNKVIGELFFSNLLQDLPNLFNEILSNSLLDSPFVCIGSKDELDEIWDVIQKETDTGTIVPPLLTSKNCTEYEKMKISIHKLNAAFNEIRWCEIGSLKYLEQKFLFEQERQLLQWHIDGVKRKTILEDWYKVEAFEAMLKGDVNRARYELTNMEEIDAQISEDIITLIMADLEENDVDGAYKIYSTQIPNKAHIRRIVQQGYGKVQFNFPKIFRFLRKVREHEPRYVGLTTLLDEMMNTTHMDCKEAFLMLNEFQKFDGSRYLSYPHYMEKIKKFLVSINNYSRYATCFKYANELNAESLNETIPLLIESVYDSKVDNLEKVLSLIPSFDVVLHKLFVLTELVHQMTINNHLYLRGSEGQTQFFKVLYRIIEVRDLVDQTSDEAARVLLNELENNLPSPISDLMYKNLCIQYKFEYLFAGSLIGERRRVAASRYSKMYRNAYSWEIELIENGTKAIIMNMKYGEHLYITGESNVGTLRSNALRTDPRAHFIIHSGTDGYYSVFNSESSKFLHTDLTSSVNDLGRDVYAKESSHTQSVWLIKTCRMYKKYD